jgi:dihydroxyacetone kinase-like predicted kinase
MNPSTADILDAIESVPAPEVLVLPNNSNVILTAEQAAELASKPVRVVPSRSVQAGFAAMVPFLATSGAAENEEAMLAVLDSAATGEVTVASRDAELDGIAIRKGAFLGLVDGTAVVADDDVQAVALEVVGRVLDGNRAWLGILTGEDAPALEGLLEVISSSHPEVEIEVHDGGQPHYPLLLVAE